jgi:protein Tex
LLRYVAGVTERTTLNIVAYRDEHGKFPLPYPAQPGSRYRRQNLRAGRRLPAHPRRREPPRPHRRLSRVLPGRRADCPIPQHPIAELIQSPQLLTKVDAKQVSAGTFTVSDILEELRKPGRDPRDQFIAPNFSETVREFADVQPGMVLEGVVTNVTKFGAFVDIGVHQDGLVHISELSNRFIKEPSEAVEAGQIVKVKVLSADLKTKRIALSIKALMAPAQGGQRPKQPAHQAPQQPSMNDKLAMLSKKWRLS